MFSNTSLETERPLLTCPKQIAPSTQTVQTTAQVVNTFFLIVVMLFKMLLLIRVQSSAGSQYMQIFTAQKLVQNKRKISTRQEDDTGCGHLDRLRVCQFSYYAINDHILRMEDCIQSFSFCHGHSI